MRWVAISQEFGWSRGKSYLLGHNVGLVNIPLTAWATIHFCKLFGTTFQIWEKNFLGQLFKFGKHTILLSRAPRLKSLKSTTHQIEDITTLKLDSKPSFAIYIQCCWIPNNHKEPESWNAKCFSSFPYQETWAISVLGVFLWDRFSRSCWKIL